MANTSGSRAATVSTTRAARAGSPWKFSTFHEANENSLAIAFPSIVVDAGDSPPLASLPGRVVASEAAHDRRPLRPLRCRRPAVQPVLLARPHGAGAQGPRRRSAADPFHRDRLDLRRRAEDAADHRRSRPD